MTQTAELTQQSYEALLDESLAWLDRQDRTEERDVIEHVLRFVRSHRPAGLALQCPHCGGDYVVGLHNGNGRRSCLRCRKRVVPEAEG